jgi:Transglutaminase-like superfamily
VLVGQKTMLGSLNRCMRCVVVSVLVIGLAIMSLLPHLGSSAEYVRMRNALLLLDDSHDSFDWTPDSIPRDFMLERSPVPPFFKAQAERLGLAGMSEDWTKVIAISRHLLSHPHLIGTPIQDNLQATYLRILADGTGYCGDLTRVFMALALAAGIPVRAWSFSLDGFGGHGHIWPEIWNRQLHRWQLVDIFNNYYFVGTDQTPVSAVQFREAMLNAPTSLRAELLSPAARPGYAVTEKMWAWYAQGLSGWYLHWGNNIYSYDSTPAIRVLGPMSYPIGQMVGIAIGVHPGIGLWVDRHNMAQVGSLKRLRVHLLLAAGLGLAAALLAVTCAFAGLVLLLRQGKKASLHGR